LAVLVGWAALAIYFAGPGTTWLRAILAAGFVGFSLWAFWVTSKSRSSRMPWTFWIWALALFGVAGWFVSIRPSHDRDWRGDVAVMPRVIVDGDRVGFSGYRDFEYRTRDDFTPRYRDWEVQLSHLTSVDLFVSYWNKRAMAHTFLSFGFDNAPPVCISIEARREKGERFAAVASLFKQFELIYVVGDERDIVRVRTNYRGEEVYMYPIRVSAEAARRLFLVYVDQINKLADEPEFYNLVSNSCTANIVRNSEVAGRKAGFDIRFVLNGLVDQYLYDKGLVDRTLPFEELRKNSRITDAAKAADQENFSALIRAAPTKSNPRSASSSL